MSAHAFVGVGRLARATRPYLVKPRHRSGGIVAPRRALVLMLAVTAVAVVTLMARALGGRVLTGIALAVLVRLRVLGRVRLFAHPGDGLADQLLDRRDAPAVGGRDDGDGGAAASGAAGAGDGMDVIVGGGRGGGVADVGGRGHVGAGG